MQKIFRSTIAKRMKSTNWGYIENSLNTKDWCLEFPDANGKEQSPIGLVTKDSTEGSGHKMEFKMDTDCNVDLSVNDTNYTWNAQEDSNAGVKLNGDEYKLLQFHFHIPSEHTIDDARCDLELHLVHACGSKMMVLGILLEKGPAEQSCSFMDQVVASMRKNKGCAFRYICMYR